MIDLASIEHNLEKDINLFFSKWIQTTRLNYKASYLISRMMWASLGSKPDIINGAICWSDEPIGASACLKIHFEWITLLSLKYGGFKYKYNLYGFFSTISYKLELMKELHDDLCQPFDMSMLIRKKLH